MTLYCVIDLHSSNSLVSVINENDFGINEIKGGKITKFQLLAIALNLMGD